MTEDNRTGGKKIWVLFIVGNSMKLVSLGVCILEKMHLKKSFLDGR